MSTACVDELTRRDDLLLLFNAISSNCPERNRPWQVQASDMLTLISRHTLSSAIQFMHSKSILLLSHSFIRYCLFAYFFLPIVMLDW
jgi:hypothetical protein